MAKKTTTVVTLGGGAVYEQQAFDYLIDQGLVGLRRNVRGRYGEIDLIMLHQDCLVFVEVRARTSQKFGGAIQSLNQAKLRRLWKTAEQYLQQYPHVGPIRFDLIAISPHKVDWLQDILSGEELIATRS